MPGQGGECRGVLEVDKQLHQCRVVGVQCSRGAVAVQGSRGARW